MFQVISPNSEQDFEDYYDFRWSMLNKPLQQPKGSERDAYDQHAMHRMVVDMAGSPLAVGRVYVRDGDEAHIRYMAVNEDHRGRGLGTLVVMSLEEAARQEGVKRVVLHARLKAIPFYEKCGYKAVGAEPTRMEGIQLQQMLKDLCQYQGIVRFPHLCRELEQIWAHEIPISDKMGISIFQYTGQRFETRASLSANVNSNHAMFAGSIYSQAVLTGWGLCWLMMKEQGLDGEIVLGKGKISYRAPVHDMPRAVIKQHGVEGSLDGLKAGGKARLKLKVELYSGDKKAATFNGLYMILPK